MCYNVELKCTKEVLEANAIPAYTVLHKLPLSCVFDWLNYFSFKLNDL